MAISLTAFRQNLYKHVKDVLADDTGSLTIGTREGQVELVNSAELRSLREFHHLFSSPANAKRLIQAIEEVKDGAVFDVSLDELRKKLDD
jgi:PHD/YefM family antitoxin component YafN of YafNO toxin-antitoxin module